MTEYINRDAAIEALAYRFAINKDDYDRAERKAVDWLPEAEEDVVKVTRCKDCKYKRDRKLKLLDDIYECKLTGLVTELDNFCKYGEGV